MQPDRPTPPPVLPVAGYDGHVPVMTDVECPRCDGGRCDCLGELVQVCHRCDEDWPCERVQAYQRGLADGRTQDERERELVADMARQRGLGEAVQFVASLLGHTLGIHAVDPAEAVRLLAAAVETAREQGRTQATEGWEREWGSQWTPPDGEASPHIEIATDEAEARRNAEDWDFHRVVSRLAAPWRPVPKGGDRD